MNDFPLDEWERAIRLGGDAAQPESETDALHLACIPIAPGEWVMFGREKARPEAGHWIVLDLYHLQPRTWPLKALRFALQGAKMNWSSYAKGRVFAWPDKRFVLRGDGEGAWLDEGLKAAVAFRLEVEAKVWNEGAPLHARIQRELGDEDADINFAARWNPLGEDAKEQFYGGSVTYAGLKKLAQLVLMQIPELCDLDEVRWRISKNYPTVFKLSRYGQPVEANQWLGSWSRFLAFDYLPKVTQAGRDKHGALQRFDSYIGSSFEATLCPSTVTMHERMEAGLQLREWLEHHAPDRMDLLP